MFRRIFASLIILSSIVAEGLTGFQGFPQSYLFGMSQGSDYSQSRTALLEQAGKDYQSKLFGGLKGLKISVSSIEKGKYWNKMPLIDEQSDFDYSPSLVKTDIIPVLICSAGKDINLFGSDVSPPSHTL